MVEGQRVQQQDGEQRGRQAAQGEVAHQLPFDIALALVGHDAARLGDGGIEQVSAHGRGGSDAEEQHQQRRHERAAAHAGHADDAADHETGQDVLEKGINHEKPNNGPSNAAMHKGVDRPDAYGNKLGLLPKIIKIYMLISKKE